MSANQKKASEGLRGEYRDKLAAGRLQPDARQAETIEHMAAFIDRLAVAKPAKSRAFWKRQPDPPKAGGFYLWGGVGRGKSMLMDLFFAHAPTAAKKRLHFHAFMLDVHDRLHGLRQKRGMGHAIDDALLRVADQVAAEARLLCFDEFQVRDVADAMILGRLFTALFERGVNVVITGNIAPDDLYRDGLQRDRFLPFISLLKERLEIVSFDGPRDYRLARLLGRKMYFWPHDEDAAQRLDDIFMSQSDGEEVSPASLPVKGRTLAIPRALRRAAAFHFDDICRINAAAVDYLALAGAYQLVVIYDVPLLNDSLRNESLRFVNLVDTLYDGGCLLALSAAASADKLYHGDELAGVFARTASRLAEMQSADYIAKDRGNTA